MSLKSKKVKLWLLTYTPQPEVEDTRYATAFLSIYNNTRENKETFIDMKLLYNGKLLFTLKKDQILPVKDWMESFEDVWIYKSAQEIEVKAIQDTDDDFDEDILIRNNNTNLDIYDM